MTPKMQTSIVSAFNAVMDMWTGQMVKFNTGTAPNDIVSSLRRASNKDMMKLEGIHWQVKRDDISTIINAVMDFDTAPRDDVIEALVAEGLRVVLEDHGVKFIEKKGAMKDNPIVQRMIGTVEHTGEDRSTFIDGTLVTVLAGDSLGTYEVYMCHNAKKIAESN